MASGTIYGSTSNEYIDSKIEWSSEVEPNTNASEIYIALYYKRNNTGFTTYGEGTFSLYSDNAPLASNTKTLTITGDAWVKAVSTSFMLSHEDDGSLSIKISAKGSISGTTLNSTSCSGTIVLDTIPRSSVITSVGDITLGDSVSVKWTPRDASFRYKLKFSLGDWSETTGYINPRTTSTYTYTRYTPPFEAVAKCITNAKQGDITVTLYTYTGGTQIGITSSKAFTVTIPENDDTKPEATMTLSPVSSLDSPLSSLYIQGYSKVDANFTNAKPKYDASVESYRMTMLGKSYSSPYTSEQLSISGDVDVMGTIEDSRGFSRTYTQKINVLPYSSPKLLPASNEKGIICERCDANGKLSSSGTYLKIKAKRSYSKITSNNVQNNFCAIRYRYRPETTNTYSAWVTLLAKSNTSTDTIDTKLSGVVSSPTTSYIIQVGVVDDIGNTDAVQFGVPSDHITLHMAKGGKRIGLLRYAMDSDEEGIDVGAPIHGGSVDNLTLGTRITASSAAPIDLNDYKTAGNFYSPSEENSIYISNTPYSGGGFGLIVRQMQSANYIRQELYYGRTNWQRHWDGTEWSGWIRYLMTPEADSFADDFVIESGEKHGWTYKKWKSGTFEMFGRFDVTATVAGTANGNMYYSEQFALQTPFACSYAVVAGTATSWFIPITGGLANNDDPENYIGFRLLRPTTFAIGATSSVRLHVTGEYVK